MQKVAAQNHGHDEETKQGKHRQPGPGQQDGQPVAVEFFVPLPQRIRRSRVILGRDGGGWRGPPVTSVGIWFHGPFVGSLSHLCLSV